MKTLFLCLLPSLAFASYPENNLDLEDTYSFTSISETEFRSVINEVVNNYKPVINSRRAQLSVEYNWSDSTVNAYASKNGNQWTLAMFGGMARRPEITRDGFQLVVCHEMGHLLGGFPFYSNEDVASEGQADYWATQACAKAVWKSGYNYARAASASQSITNLLATLEGSSYPSQTRKDPSVVLYSVETHPAAQCRLDTYLAGAFCSTAFPLYAYPTTQQQAFVTSCQNRPRCWFASQR